MNSCVAEGLREYNRGFQSNRKEKFSTEQQEQERRQNVEAHRERREDMTKEALQDMRGRYTAVEREIRVTTSEKVLQAIEEQNTAARREARYAMTEVEHHDIQQQGTAARGVVRDAMTEEELEQRKKAEIFWRKSRQYQKSLSYYEDFDPSFIPGRRHYFSRYTDGAQERERVCSGCNVWKFPHEKSEAAAVMDCVHAPRSTPIELRRLYRNPGFKQLIRASNNVSAFTSTGSLRFRPLNVDESITWGRSAFVCKGSYPTDVQRMRKYTSMIRIYKVRVASRMDMTDRFDKDILETIDQVMTTHNPYSQRFMIVRNLLSESAGPEYQATVEEFVRRDRTGCKIQTAPIRGTKREPRYSQPLTASEVVGIIIDGGAAEHRDIILHPWQGGFEQIFETSASYDPLHYPLLFPYGEPGWTFDVPYAGTSDDPNIGAISLRGYESYLLHDRTNSDVLILKAWRLTQQYCVNQSAKYEQSQLQYIENNQLLYRLETLQGLTDAFQNESIGSAEPEASNLDHKVIILPTFTGGPRYMYQRFLDAVAIVRETGAPNLFIAMTRGEQASDPPDIVARVFLQKLKALNKNLDEGVLGVVAVKVHVVEYQKRGLPHAHIFLIMRLEDKPVSAEDVDRLVSAELPDKKNIRAI
ncbi:LOW QUALITY PROTEIN: Helitron helicase [Phytophthora megakarya]|uniref:Helitron helicase n=1 Tax=Phytophthora megakarya TaxID=4795 RepID=A0A225W9S9_9STRA|nr:LOW QUALITY PROTEIN: Helitron helicase [Phytophthora megakarya]